MQGLATAHELSFTNRRHVSVTQLEAAIKDLVNAHHRCDLPKVWGSGSSAAADGTKYELAENSLLAEYSIRYGGYGGIAYHHVSDTYIALFSHFIPCGVWEAIYIPKVCSRTPRTSSRPPCMAIRRRIKSAPIFGL